MTSLYALILALSLHPVVASAETPETSMVNCYPRYLSMFDIDAIDDLDALNDLDLCEETAAKSTTAVPSATTEQSAGLDWLADDVYPSITFQPSPEDQTGSFAGRWNDDEIFFRADDEDVIYRLDDEIFYRWFDGE